eukprot:876885-Heterocapsa_arctica.AAC.2
MEAGYKVSKDWLGQIKESLKGQPQEKAQPKKLARKRQEEAKQTREASAGSGSYRATKSQTSGKEQPAIPKEGQTPDRRRELDSEGFSHIFRGRPQGSQDQTADTGSISKVGITPDSGNDRTGFDSDHDSDVHG